MGFEGARDGLMGDGGVWGSWGVLLITLGVISTGGNSSTRSDDLRECGNFTGDFFGIFCARIRTS